MQPNRASCAALIPPDWEKGVGSAEFEGDGTAKADWEIFADRQTARVEQADGRTKDTIHIVRACEERDSQAVTHATKRGILHRVFGATGWHGYGVRLDPERYAPG